MLGKNVKTNQDLITWVTSETHKTPKGILIIDPAGSMFDTHRFVGSGFSGGLYHFLHIYNHPHNLSAPETFAVFDHDNLGNLRNFNNRDDIPIHVLHVHSPFGKNSNFHDFIRKLQMTLVHIFTEMELFSQLRGFTVILPLISSGIRAPTNFSQNEREYAATFTGSVVLLAKQFPTRNTFLIPHPKSEIYESAFWGSIRMVSGPQLQNLNEMMFGYKIGKWLNSRPNSKLLNK
jgi:hypothetical protein